MKVLVFVVLAVGVSSAARSGPYLPSGWRPHGPAFYLPGEAKKPSENPLRDNVQVEAEGSDSLREYGPPKEVPQDLTKQELPDVSTEQSFLVIDARVGDNELEQETVEEERDEKQDVVDNVETNEGSAVETEKANSNIVSAVQENEEKSVEEEAGVVIKEEGGKGVKNIADALANLENEIKVQQVQSGEDDAQLRTVEGVSESLDETPEGFLEYGLPGFKEYGPPNQGNARSAAVIATLIGKAGTLNGLEQQKKRATEILQFLKEMRKTM